MLKIIKNKIKLNGKTLYQNSNKSVLYEVFLRLEAYVNRYAENSVEEALADILDELDGDI